MAATLARNSENRRVAAPRASRPLVLSVTQRANVRASVGWSVGRPVGRDHNIFPNAQTERQITLVSVPLLRFAESMS